MYPRALLESNPDAALSGTCFVLMPFASEFDEIYDIIRETMESSEVNFSCKRADDILGPGHIMDSVLHGIASSEIIIADLSGSNPNVFYELGIAHVLKQPNKVILLIKEIETMPFDLGAFRSIVYKQTISGAKQLKTDLQNAVNEAADLIKLAGRDNHPVYQFVVTGGAVYKFPLRLFGKGNCLYDFEIYGDYIGEDGLKCSIGFTKYAAGLKPEKLPVDGIGMPQTGDVHLDNIPWRLKIHKLSGKNATFQLIHI